MMTHLHHIDGGAGKKLVQAPALDRGFRMQGKGPPVNLDLMFLLQLFNTPGNEIAPGSDIIGKDLESFHELIKQREKKTSKQ